MSALLTEIVSYLIKFVAMIVCAFLGIQVGKVLRKRKDEKVEAADSGSNE